MEAKLKFPPERRVEQNSFAYPQTRILSIAISSLQPTGLQTSSKAMKGYNQMAQKCVF